MNLVQEALDEMRRQDGTEIVSERIIDRARGNLAGAGAAGKWLWNRVSGKKDQNQAGFRETARNARFSGTIKSHAKVVHDLLGEINQFIAQQAEQGKDTSELEKISGGISDFFAKNEKIFGMGLGDADAEDYKNQELPPQQQPEQPAQPEQPEQPEQSASPEQPEQPEQSVQPGQPEQSAQPGQQPEQSASPEQPEQSAQPEHLEQSAPSGQPGQSAQPGPSSQSRPRQQMQQMPVRKKKKSGFWTNDNVWLNARNESTALNYLYGQILLGENNDEHSAPAYTISSLYNKILISEAQQQPKQQMPPEVNNAIAQVYSKLGDLADQGSEEDKDFVYQLIQKMAQGTPMQEILKELEARGNQEKQQAGQQPQESVTEGFSDMRRRFYARQAGKEAAKAGGDRKAAQQEAYDNRIYEFQTRLDRALGELSLDLKTMGYKQQGGDADRLILAFRKAVSQFSKSKKEEGETSWLQRRRHGLGHALATSATYAALRAVCPATILGNKYFARGLYGAATSVIRDVSRGNLNKKSILRALAGAGIAIGATIAGEMIRPEITSTKFDATANDAIDRTHSINGAVAANHSGVAARFSGQNNSAANLGTRIRAMFDSNLKSKLGLKLDSSSKMYSAGYGGSEWVPHETGAVDHWGNPEVDYYTRRDLTFDDFAKSAKATADKLESQLVSQGVDQNTARNLVQSNLEKALNAAKEGGKGLTIDADELNGDLLSQAGGGTDAISNAATDAATGTGAEGVGGGTSVDTNYGSEPASPSMSGPENDIQLPNGRDTADIELDDSSYSGVGAEGRAPGTYEGGIRTADANGNPVELSPEDAAKVNAVRSVRSQMEGGAGGATEEMPANVKNALGYTDEGELDLEQVPRSPRPDASSVPATGGGASDEMPANVKNALGYTDEGELDLEQAPRISKVDTSSIKRRPGESVAVWSARKKAAELKGIRDQLLKAGYGKTTVTPTGTRTTLNGRIVGGKFIPD